MSQKPYLNLGCGRVILPAPAPSHYSLIDPGLTEYALWQNVDRNAEPGVDECVDIFRYPFPWADNSFDGALCAHLVEHIPHEIHEAKTPKAGMPGWWPDRVMDILEMQDGWYAFFSELYRVLTPGSIIHILSPYGWSNGAMTDPSHVRYLTEASFTHSMQPDPNAPFAYQTGGLNLELVEAPRLNITNLYQHLLNQPDMFRHALNTQINVAYEIYAKLRVVK